MWILLLLFMKADGGIIAYDQGRYDSWEECYDVGKTTVSELDGAYIHQCVEWKRKK